MRNLPSKFGLVVRGRSNFRLARSNLSFRWALLMCRVASSAQGGTEGVRLSGLVSSCLRAYCTYFN